MRNLLVICLLFSICLFSQGQTTPLIVKDVVNCAVGLQDNKGNWIIQPVYNRIDPFQNNFAVVHLAGKSGLINSKGIEVIPPHYYSIVPVRNVPHNNYTSTDLKGLYLCLLTPYHSIIIDSSGNTILDCKLQLNPHFRDSVCIAKRSDHDHFLVHLNGTIITIPGHNSKEPVVSTRHRYIFETDSAVPVQGKTYRTVMIKFKGLIEDNGNVILPAHYDKISTFGRKGDMLQVEKNGKTGFCTESGQTIWPCAFSILEPVLVNPNNIDGNAIYLAALNDTCWGVITPNGDSIIPFVSRVRPLVNRFQVHESRDTQYVLCTSSGYGVARRNLKWVIQPEYDFLEDFCYDMQGYYSASEYYLSAKDGYWGVIDTSGSEYIGHIFDTAVRVDRTKIMFLTEEVYYAAELNIDYPLFGVSESMLNDWFPNKESRNRHFPPNEDYPYWNDKDTVIMQNSFWEEAITEYMWDSIENLSKRKRRKIRNPYPHMTQGTISTSLIVIRMDTLHSKSGLITYTSGNNNLNRISYSGRKPIMCFTDTTLHTVYTCDHESDGYYRFAYGSGLAGPSGRVIFAPGQYTGVYKITDNPVSFVAHDTSDNAILIDSFGTQLLRLRAGHISLWKDDTLWVCSSDNISSVTHEAIRCTKTWKLYDVSERSYLATLPAGLNKRLQIDTAKPIQSFSTNRGNGVINTKTMEILIDPVYSYCERMSPCNPYYLIESEEGLCGIADTTNQIIVKPEFYSCVLISRKITGKDKSGRNEYKEHYLLLRPDKTALEFFTDGTFHELDSTRQRLLVTDVIRQSHENAVGGFNTCTECGTWITEVYRTPLHNWQYDFLYRDLFFTPSRHFPSIYLSSERNSCGKRNVHSYVSHQFTTNRFAYRQHKIKYSTDSILSFVVLPTRSSDELDKWRDPEQTYVTICLTSSGPVRITLDSLFQGALWRQIITDSVMSFLRAHPEIDADCSKPGAYSFILNDRFLIFEDGIRLYPYWFMQTNGVALYNRPELFIPWAALRQYLKPEFQTKF